MKSLFFFAIVIVIFACTNVEKYYFVYADGEWVQVEEDPRPDNGEEKEIEDVTENSDNENIAVSDDSEVVTEEHLKPDEENPEEFLSDEDAEITDDAFIVPDADFCDQPCTLLYDNYDGYYGKDKENGKRIRLHMTPTECRCETEMILTDEGYRESFFGFYFPLNSDNNSNTLSLGSNNREIIFFIASEDKERTFEEIQ